MNKTEPFPMDWDEWRAEWRAWCTEHADDLKPTRKLYPGKNVMADDVLGTWIIRGQLTELSAFTFPNLEERDESGRLIDKDHRSVGITRGIGVDSDSDVAHSFADLERLLGIEPITDTIERARLAQQRDRLLPDTHIIGSGDERGLENYGS